MKTLETPLLRLFTKLFYMEAQTERWQKELCLLTTKTPLITNDQVYMPYQFSQFHSDLSSLILPYNFGGKTVGIGINHDDDNNATSKEFVRALQCLCTPISIEEIGAQTTVEVHCAPLTVLLDAQRAESELLFLLSLY